MVSHFALTLCAVLSLCLFFAYQRTDEERRVSRKLIFDRAEHTIYHNKVYNSNMTHHKSWMALESVNGLKNEEIAMFLISTEAHGSLYLRERLINPNGKFSCFV